MKPNTSELLPLDQYDLVKVDYSGGKDSTAAVLHLLDLGVPKERMELWHHLIDGAPGEEDLMDWPCTPAYCEAFAAALGVRLRRQWKEGGFKGELLRENSRTRPTTFEISDGTLKTVGVTRGNFSTRRKWPQQASDLNVRWCSAYLKIDVCAKAMANDPALRGKRILEVTGERREESPNRAGYAEIEKHRTSNSVRRVDQWRIVIDWDESSVWEIIKRYRVRPHPAYYLGFGRVSCMKCIFGLPDQWATVRELDPEGFQRIADLEAEFEWTINRKLSVVEMANRGKPHLEGATPEMIRLALSKEYPAELIMLDPAEEWILPSGAFKRCGGPT